MIELRNLKKEFEEATPFCDINTTINKGDSISIIGPSGTGKTTLLRCINMMDPPTSGQVIVDGEDVTVPGYDLTGLRKKIGMVFQSFNLFEHYTVIENLMEPQMLLMGKKRQEAYDRAVELLKTVNLSSKALAYPSELSGGQKQRVAIARTLAMDPEVILFDEPTSALDPAMVGEVEDVIRKLKKTGITMMVVTHEMRFAREIANRVYFLADGIIYEEGTPEQVFDNPQKPLTREFFSRRRTCEIEATREADDYYSMATAFREFMIPYGADKRQQEFFSVLCDEFLYPLFEHSESDTLSVNMKLICSESDMLHKMVISVTGIEEDPLSEPYLDELNCKIFRSYITDLICEETGNGWQLAFTLEP